MVNFQATEGITANIEIHPNVTLSASDLTALCRLQGLTAGSLDDDFDMRKEFMWAREVGRKDFLCPEIR